MDLVSMRIRMGGQLHHTLRWRRVERKFMGILLIALIYPSIIDISSYLNFYRFSLNSFNSTSLTRPTSTNNFLDSFTADSNKEFFNIEHSYYDFTEVKRAFHHRTSLHYLTQFDKLEVVRNVLHVLPVKLRIRAYRYLPYFFYYAEKYKVDPYWAIAIAWTESHFNFRARSHVGAQGIMQIMPSTEQWLERFVRDNSYDNRIIKNIHLGIFYLAKLLKQFHGNYREATVAYNMGPGWVKRWKQRRRFVGSRNNIYLRKVKRYYKQLSVAHYHFVKECDREYLKTFVVLRKANVEEIDWQQQQQMVFKLALAPRYSQN